MSRGWKIAAAIALALAILLVANMIATDSETKPAQVTAEGARILELPDGDVQVLDTGRPQGRKPGQPIVLVHCYACSLHWYDRLRPLLARNHRVISIDQLGFGGSEKPESGFEIAAQGRVLAQALNALEVQGALVVGHSMGGMVAASLAEQASQLVDRIVVIGMAPNTRDFGEGLPLTARLAYVPVVGQALWRFAPDFVVRDAYADSFAPGYETDAAFENPDQVLEDYRAMTYSSYDGAHHGADAYLDAVPLDERLTRVAVPLMVIFGAEDQIFDAEPALSGFEDVPGARTRLMRGAGHSPQLERPREAAKLIEAFAAPRAR